MTFMPEVLTTPEDEPVIMAFLAEMRGITALNVPSIRTTPGGQDKPALPEEDDEETP